MASYLRFHKILEMLEEDSSIEVSSIVLQPSEYASKPVSDKNSGEEDGGIVNNLPNSMLRAPVFSEQNGHFVAEDSPCLSKQKLPVDLNVSRSVMIIGVMCHFEAIFSYLHVGDNVSLELLYKLSLLRPLISILNKRCMKYLPNETCFSIDESMIPYYGRHGSMNI